MMGSFGYRYNPNYVPEPKFIPGYGGYLPNNLTKYGMTYGNLSHQVLRDKPLLAARLAPLQPPSKDDEPDPLSCECQCAVEYHKENIISDDENMFIPDYVCPGYTGCLTLNRKGLPLNSCCETMLRSLGCDLKPCQIQDGEVEDPFPGPPKQMLDHTQEGRRCENGMWKRFPKNYVSKNLHKWM